MLIISEELRDNINKFLGGIQVPVFTAPHFLEVIKILSELQQMPENKEPEKKGKKNANKS